MIDIIGKKWWFKDPSKIPYLEAIPLSDRIETAIVDALRRKVKVSFDDILQEIIGCAHEEKCNDNCTKAFRIVPNELQIYKQLKIPLPILCPNCRHYRRLSKKNPIQLWDRKCDKCGVSIKTSYSPDRPEIVYCESCYNNEIL